MAQERNQRAIYDGQSKGQNQVRRGPDRRNSNRRKSDIVEILIKYLILIVVGALVVKVFKF